MSFISFLVTILVVRTVCAQENNTDTSFELSAQKSIFQPLPPLPDMTNAQSPNGPPGFAPPKNLKDRLGFDGSIGFVVRRGTAKIMGVSRRKTIDQLEERN